MTSLHHTRPESPAGSVLHIAAVILFILTILALSVIVIPRTAGATESPRTAYVMDVDSTATI